MASSTREENPQLLPVGGAKKRWGFGGTGVVWLLTLPILLFVLLFASPLIDIVQRAWQHDGAAGFADVIRDPLFLSALRRTAMISVVVSAASLVLSVLYLLAIVLSGTRLRGILLICLLSSFWISLLVRTYGWLLFFTSGGALERVLQAVGLLDGPLTWIDSGLAMYPAMVHIMMPFLMLPLVAALSNFDHRQILAAQSLGAGPWRVLFTAVLPQLRQAAAAGTTLVFILSFGFFVTPAFLGGPKQLTVATLINYEFSQLRDAGTASIQGTLLLVAVVLMYVVADRLFGLSRAIDVGRS